MALRRVLDGLVLDRGVLDGIVLDDGLFRRLGGVGRRRSLRIGGRGRQRSEKPKCAKHGDRCLHEELLG
jgi:hypothetical protein